MAFIKTLLLSLCVLFLCTCAASYKSINPSSLNYTYQPENDGLIFSYQAGVLQDSGNKKLAKKEDRFDIRVVAVKITNNTGRDLTFAKDLVLKSGFKVFQPLDPETTASSIKQSSASYLLFLLLTPMKLYVGNNETGEVSETPIGYVLGPGLAALNVAKASSANTKFKKELSNNDIYNRVIPNGETVYGLVSLSDYNFSNLSLELKNN